jgi:hypothetical protein
MVQMRSFEEVTRHRGRNSVADIAGIAEDPRPHQKTSARTLEPTVTAHPVNSTSILDGFLAMFDSPVEAVRCAVVIQQVWLAEMPQYPESTTPTTGSASILAT